MVGSGAPDLDLPWQYVSWTVVHVASNGQRPADPVEVACLPVDGGRPGRVRTWLVRPPRPVSGFSSSVHGITNDDLESAPGFGAVAQEIRDATAGRVVVGHHLHTDLDVLDRAMGGGWRPPVSVDTMRLALALWPDRSTYGLHALAEDISARPPAGVHRHRAGHDAVLAAALFLALARAAAGDLDRRPSAGELVVRALPPRPIPAAADRSGGHR